MSDTTKVNARDEIGNAVGLITVECDGVGDPPRVVEDQYGSTWLLIPPMYGQPSYYERVRRVAATLRVQL